MKMLEVKGASALQSNGMEVLGDSSGHTAASAKTKKKILLH